LGKQQHKGGEKIKKLEKGFVLLRFADED